MRQATRRTREASDEARHWAITREHIGHQLKTFYERCMTDELPPRLREALKELDEETPEASNEQPALIRDIEN
jgi:predicted metal-dependent hydrolase